VQDVKCLYRKALAGLSVVVGLALSAVLLAGAGDAPSRADANLLRQKIAGITAFGERPSRRLNQTTVTEKELNAFLAYDADEHLPPGVVEPAITIAGAGRVSARAVVDLDAVRKQKPRSSLDPLGYATGRLPVTAAGVLRTSNGIGRFELESATIASIPVPKPLLQEIVTYYSRTAENPTGIGLDDSFQLPSRIREIHVEPGRAVIIQ
jgi:hypothetical protein